MKAVLSRLLNLFALKSPTERPRNYGLTLALCLTAFVVICLALILADGGGPFFALSLLGAVALMGASIAMLLRRICGVILDSRTR